MDTTGVDVQIWAMYNIHRLPLSVHFLSDGEWLNVEVAFLCHYRCKTRECTLYGRWSGSR